MRVLSMYQPYATLLVMGLKTNETRSWDTRFRGTLAIHATAKMPAWCKELLLTKPFKAALQGIELPHGAIVGTVDVVSTMPTTEWLSRYVLNYPEGPLPDEFYYGDYGPDRYAWQTIHPMPLENPIPARGAQGFWNYSL